MQKFSHGTSSCLVELWGGGAGREVQTAQWVDKGLEGLWDYFYWYIHVCIYDVSIYMHTYTHPFRFQETQ